MLVSGASAYFVHETVTIDAIYNLGFRNNSPHANVDDILGRIDVGYNVFIKALYYQGQNSELYIVVAEGDIVFQNNIMYISNSDATVYQLYWSFNDYSRSVSLTSPGTATIVLDDTTYYRCEFAQYWNVDYWDALYCTNNFYYANTYYDFNLLYGSFEPDSRIFEVWKSVEYPESSNPLEYINVKLDGYVDLNKISTQKIRFDYSDQDGNNLYKVFSESDFHDIQYDSSEDLFTFYIFPYLISSYEFTITAATYYADNEWAEKTIELDLTYNEDVIYPLPSGWNDSYYITQYFDSNSNGRLSYGRASIEYKVVGIYTYWTDGDLVCWQNFDVKGLFVPDFLTSDFQNNLDMQEVYSLFDQYDVIFTDCIEAEIDGICGQYVYHNTHDVFLQQGFIPALRFLISQGVIQQHRSLPLSVDSSGLSYFDNVANGFIVTRSFLLKRMLSSLGDVDDRLLEFETNLFDEDGFGVSLQNKLDNILSLENSFFSDVSRFFQKLEYNLNGLSLGRIEKYLEDIWSATVGERNFNYTDLLPDPLKSIFLYFRGWFISSTQYMQDFIDVSNSSLYGDDLMTLPFEASTVPVLPFEPGTPTPIPIPTLEAGLIEVGGD